MTASEMSLVPYFRRYIRRVLPLELFSDGELSQALTACHPSHEPDAAMLFSLAQDFYADVELGLFEWAESQHPRAPEGGASVQGHFFHGGEFIPKEVMAEATPKEKAKILGEEKPEEPSHAEPKPERKAEPERPVESAGEPGRPDVGGTDSGGTGGPGAAGGRKSRILTAREHLVKAADPALVHESIRKHLNEPQIQGAAKAVEAMDKHGGFLLSDGTGVGKTRQALAVAKTYAERGKKVLIVAPAEVLKQDWKKGTVAGSYANDAKAMGIGVSLNKDQPLKAGEIHLSTYDQLGKLKGHIDSDTTVIFDESHALKNWGSIRAKHGYEISKAAGQVMYATATPADKPLHIAHLFRAKIFGTRKWEETYRELGMRQVEQRTYGGGTVKKWEIDPRVGRAEVYRRMSGLFDRMIEDGLMMRREISLDGVQVHSDRVALPAETKAAVEKVFSDKMRETDGNKAVALMAARMAQEVHKIPHVVNAVQEELKAGRSVVVFAARVNPKEAEEGEDGDQGEAIEGTMKLLREQLEAAGVKDITELHGGATKTPAQKAKAMEAFQSGKAKVILATIESGGTGVNLDDTVGDKPRTTIVITPPFSAVSHVQLAGRTWRLNTKSDAKIRHVFADTAIDDWNAALVARKMKVHGAVVSGEAAKLAAPSDEPEELEIGGEHTSPYHWPPLIRQAEPSSGVTTGAKPAATAAVRISGDTYTHKDRIKAAGGRWDGVSKTWTISADKADTLRKLSGLSFSDKARKETAVPAPSAQAAAPAPSTVSDAHRKSVHAALKSLAANDPDRARERNAVGFNQMDSEFGSQLAEASQLTDRQAIAGAKLLAKYHRQISPEHLAHAKELLASASTEPAKSAEPDKLVVSGNTYAHKERIKAAGGRWDGNRGVWLIPANVKSKLEHLHGLRFS